MKKLSVIVALLAFFVSANAQQQQGDLAIQFSGNYFSQKVTVNDTDIKTFGGNIYVKLGKYFTQNLELGVKPNIAFFPKTEVEGTTIKQKLDANFGFGIYGTYSFLSNDGKMLPYAGAEISYVPSGEESTVNLGPYAGVKYFLSEKINVDANLSYLLGLGSTYGQSDNVKIGGLLNFNLGIGVILGKIN